MNIKIRKDSSIIEKNCNYTAESHRHINRIQNLHCKCKLTRIIRTYRLEILVILVIFNLIENTLGNPVFVDNPSIAQFQSGRNIRHLPCIVRKSGLSGTCMFAIDCIKQNGTHLGTCIDRFYFGSCCQMKEDIPYYSHDINDNSIDQNTISHFAHESSTVIPQTSAIFKPTTESLLISSSDSLLKNNSTKNKLTSQMPHVSISSNIPMQNRETPTTPQKIAIDLITTYKPIIKYDIPGNLSTFLSSSSTPSTLTTSADLLLSTLSNTDSTSTSVSLSSNISEISSITKTPSHFLFSDSFSFESLSSPSITSHSTVEQSSSSLSLPSTQSPSSLPSQVTTPYPDLLKPLQTSTNPVLTTTKTSEKPFQITTEESKFSTFQIVETTTPTAPTTTPTVPTTTPTIPTATPTVPTTTPIVPTKTPTVPATTPTVSSVSKSTPSSSLSPLPPSSSSPSSIVPKLPQTTYIPSSKQPITTINVTNKPPLSSRRPTTQRTKVTRRPTTATKPTISSTAFPSTSRKPPLHKTTTVRAKPQISSSTRRSTTPKRPPTKRPTTISIIRPKPITKRPTTISSSTIVTTLPKTDATVVKNTTVGASTQNFTSELPALTTTTTTKSTTTQLPLVPAVTKAPRPKPKPTGNIIKVSPSIISDKVTESISTVAPPSVATNKPLLITGKPLTTKPIPITHKPTKNTLSSLSTEKPITASSTIRPLLNNTSKKPTITESTTVKPSELVTWTKVDGPSINNTDKNNDWIPRPPPDWVLLPTIKPDSDINKTAPILPSKTNVSTTQGMFNGSEVPTTTPQSIATFVTLLPETSSFLTHLVNQSSNDALSSLNTENSVNSLNGSTTPPTTVNINSGDGSTISTTSTTPIPSLEGLDYKQICGKRMFPEPRIVGGANAAFGRWPWQISLRQWRTSTYLHKCGAALLNENWAITAAHCVDNVPPSDLLLRLGEYDLAEEEEPYSYQERRVQIVASHPQFDPRTFEYDLALLRFYEPVAFQPNIIPVCVPDNDYDFLEQTAYVTGWGRLYEDGPLPSVLQEVSVPVINNTICETMYRAAGYIEHIPHIFICAGWKKGGYDSCEGDSGGPMVLQRDDKRFVLGGVISWGIGCAEPNQPGVYTRISEFRDWINQILQF